jgi:ubiquinone/menaquinone biosynthesis C-methylase UbiE
MEELKSCPLCSGTEFGPYIKAKDYTVSKQEFSIVSCLSCGFKFTNPRPQESALPDYYKAEAYISHTDTSAGLVNKLYKLVRSFTLKSKLNLVSPHLRGNLLLDIGAGTGAFLNEVKRKYPHVCGVEPDPDASRLAKEKYDLDLFAESYLSELKDKSCDVITMWHVLEHVPRLRDRVQELSRLLADGGIVVVAVPNYQAYDASYYGKYWAAYDVPRHLYHFDKQSIEQLFSSFGFKLKETRIMPFDSFYVSILSEKYRHGKSNLLRALAIGLLSLLKGTNKNTSSLIYIFNRN